MASDLQDAAGMVRDCTILALPGDAALSLNLRDLDCAPRANGGDEDDDDGGEKTCGSMKEPA
jgi:hypothetical protein